MQHCFRILRFASVAAMIASYAVLVHYVNTSGQATSLGAALALAPFLLIGGALLSRAESRFVGMFLIVAVLALAWWNWPLIKQHTGLIFWLQDVSLLLALLMTFARTLAPGHKPLCVGFAEAIHGGQLPPAHLRYAKQVTVAWVIFFALMALISTLLFFFMPLAVWSFFVNFLTLPFVALMFIIEYLVRHQVLPDAPQANIMAAVKAYKNMSGLKH
ncbi:MAG TPA: hypothetical protein VEA39_01680 [Methylophilaceae bacterium]|nr:hypothetical protein [Methylophilaceae bacterium]